MYSCISLLNGNLTSYSISSSSISFILFTKKELWYLCGCSSTSSFLKFYLFWERGKERIPSSQSQMRGLNSQTMRSSPEPKSRVGRLLNWATQVPQLPFWIIPLICASCFLGLLLNYDAWTFPPPPLHSWVNSVVS